MKLQNLTVIFIIIIIPIILIFTYYISLQSKTIKLQTDYDEKLIEATREGVEAFEINTTEWNSKYSTLANSKRRDLLSSVNVFTTSLANKLGMGGMSKENILNYIPAIVYIMYDGYYIYSPTYVPKTLTNDNGVQLFYYGNAEGDAKIAAKATQEIEGKIYPGKPIYFLESGQSDIIQYKNASYTTDIAKADKTYKHVLKTFVPYTAQVGDYTINYTLDGYIRVFGNGETREGYVLDKAISVPQNSIDGITYDGNIITPEGLYENIVVEGNIEGYKYIYNSNNDKRYYDTNGFFTVDKNYKKVYLPEVDVRK